MEGLPTTSQIANPLRNLGGFYLDLSKCAIGKEAGVQLRCSVQYMHNKLTVSHHSFANVL